MYASLAALLFQGGQTAAEAGPFEPFLPGLVVLLPLVGFLINGALALSHARRSADAVRAGGELDLDGPEGRPATHTLPTWIGPGVMALAFLITLVNFTRMLGAELHEPVVLSYWTWMATGTFSVAAALQLDQLSMVMMLVVTGVGFLIHVFSVGYMKEDPGYPRYFAYLNLFVFFMLVLVMGASYPLMFVGWEGVGLCSYLLIGFWFSDREKADAGKKAFIVNRIGDFGFLIAMFLLFAAFGTLDFVPVFGEAESLVYGGGLVTAITLFFFLGAAGKSAQIPLYIWLPDAMAGPTPVSALIHAATMVTAGVYLVARSSVLFALSPVASATVAGIGALTALFAATIALKQYDIKRVLAYSTGSQLGLRCGHLPPDDPCVLQGSALPWVRRCDSLHARSVSQHAQPRRSAGHA
jgi:NADH-quinone oxidoreductase subunit L